MRNFQREAIQRDAELAAEIAGRLVAAEGALGPGGGGGPGPAAAFSLERLRPRAAVLDQEASSHALIEAFRGGAGAEAIVLRLGRPTLLVRSDTFEVPLSDTWRARLTPTRTNLEAAIRSVGRVEVGGGAHPYVGTAWMIAKNVVVTNRHVALEFARRRGSEFVFRSNPIGEPYRPRVDFKEEHVQVTPFEARVTKVLHIAGLDDNAPDVAFLALAPPAGRTLPPPIPLFDGPPQEAQVVAVVGYPAEDPRNDLADQARLFGGVFDVKRLAPGLVMGTVDASVFKHDCTTLGGSSGSVVVDVATGSALGLHFAGEFLDANYAVNARTLHRLLTKLGEKPLVVSAAAAGKVKPEGRTPVGELAGRTGFSEAFLGTGPLKVALPTLSPGLAKLAVTAAPKARGTARFLLPYLHFSVATHAERRMALFTAVNIDGAQARKVKRKEDVWSFDPRLTEGNQVGNALYAGNDLDRGHLVRRLDPVWGSEAEAATAEKDTFFYTNSTPQHSRFNQHLWLALEDYLLDHADTLDFRASVFTGPVFDDDDKAYRGVLLPQAFWKVAVMVHAERKQLTATAYIVSQADLLTNIEFVFGEFKTYQVPIRRIEALTGLRFGRLKDVDPLGKQEAASVATLTSAADIRL